MAETVLTNMTMLENGGRVLVIDRVKRFQGIAFPGGKVEPGESLYDSAVREFREETGLEIKDLNSAGVFYWEGEDGYKYFVFLYKAAEYTGELKGSTDEGRVFWMEKENLRECGLAPHMEKYLTIFEEEAGECFCTWQDGYEPHYR